jgi:HSP20 family protein
MQDRINRMNRLFRESYSAEGPEEALTYRGYRQKDIDVRIESNTLTAHGERKIEKEEKEENFRRVERQYRRFTRSFALRSSVDAGQVNVHYDKGVLKISLPKKTEAKPKQIKVNVGGEQALETKVNGKAA